MELVIVTPPVATSTLELGLVELTRAIVATGVENTGGLLGGEFGYGALWDDDTFSMHPFCWCELADCAWCRACECPPSAVRYFLANGEQVDAKAFYAQDRDARSQGRREDVPENQCVNCRNPGEPAPNFWHKSSGLQVRWYKWIGRGMELTGEVDEVTWAQILDDCLRAVAAGRSAT